MKKYLIYFLFITYSSLVSQTKQESISISYQEKTKKEIILLIEKNTNYQFYYIDNWLDDEKHSDNFKNASIDQILRKILSNTSLNYSIIEESKIIITKGNRLHKSLYDEPENKNKIVESSVPIFIESSSNTNDMVVSIGKESITNKKKDVYYKWYY